MEITPQDPTGPLAEETPRRDAMRAMGAAGAALLGALGMNAASPDATVQGKSKRVGSEKKRTKGKKGKRGPAGPAGPQGPPGQNAGTIYWASVDSQGAFLAGKGFVRSQNIGGKTGQYSVSTERDDVEFASCAVVGMADDGNRVVLGTITSPGMVTLRTQRFDNVEHLYHDTDSAFSLIVICPAE